MASSLGRREVNSNDDRGKRLRAQGLSRRKVDPLHLEAGDGQGRQGERLVRAADRRRRGPSPPAAEGRHRGPRVGAGWSARPVPLERGTGRRRRPDDPSDQLLVQRERLHLQSSEACLRTGHRNEGTEADHEGRVRRDKGGVVARRSPDRLRRANGRPTPISSGPLRPRRRLPEGEAADEPHYGNRLGRLVSGRSTNRVPRERTPARLRLPRPPVVDQGIWDGCTQTPRFSGSQPFEQPQLGRPHGRRQFGPEMGRQPDLFPRRRGRCGASRIFGRAEQESGSARRRKAEHRGVPDQREKDRLHRDGERGACGTVLGG